MFSVAETHCQDANPGATVLAACPAFRGPCCSPRALSPYSSHVECCGVACAHCHHRVPVYRDPCLLAYLQASMGDVVSRSDTDKATLPSIIHRSLPRPTCFGSTDHLSDCSPACYGIREAASLALRHSRRSTPNRPRLAPGASLPFAHDLTSA